MWPELKDLSGKHQEIIDYLVERLEESGRYESIETHVRYHRRAKRGEVDVLAFHASSNTFHFYEVKCNSSLKVHPLSAQGQYERYCRAFPKRNVKGIRFSYGYVRRLRL